MKNVTGYDLSKLMTGSLGTLGAMTGLTIKVLPVPEETRTVAVLGLDAAAAIAGLTEALQSPYEVTGAAHLPEATAGGVEAGGLADVGASATVLRVEGFPASVDFRCGWLTSLFSDRGEVRVVDGGASRALWREIRDVKPFAAAGDDRQVWRLSVPPADAAALAARLATDLSAQCFFDWGGGLVWAASRPAKTEGRRRSVPPWMGSTVRRRWCGRPHRCGRRWTCSIPFRRTGSVERTSEGCLRSQAHPQPGRMQAGV